MRIALFRPLGLASLLCAIPALRALDAAYPHAEFTLIGAPHLREVAARLHRYLDGFVAFPGFPGISGIECDLEAIPGFFERVKAARFDLAIQMHGAGEIANPLMVLMGAAHNAGFYRPGRYCPDAQRYLEWREDEEDVQRWVRLAEHLGARAKGTFLEFPLEPEDRAQWRARIWRIASAWTAAAALRQSAMRLRPRAGAWCRSASRSATASAALPR